MEAAEAANTAGAGGETDRAQVICITPVRNEAWILERFLRCASLWADQIIVVDQKSDDGSREIAAAFPKVRIVDYPDGAFSEPERRRLLIAEARRVPGKRLIVSLDADEALSANWEGSPEWEQVLRAPPGTWFRLEWANLLPGCGTCWVPETPVFAMMDDGAELPSVAIHGPRLPPPREGRSILLREVKVLHYMCTDWERMMSKQRWYQCWERLNSSLRPIPLYRRYHHMHAVPREQVKPVAPEWFEGYTRRGIDMRGVGRQEFYRWDKEVLQLLVEHGASRFRKIDIWDVDWVEMARKLGTDAPPARLRDPRGPFTRFVHRWLRATQPRMAEPRIRLVQRSLIPLGW